MDKKGKRKTGGKDVGSQCKQRNIFTMMFCWLSAPVVALLLVVINRIYLHHNLERLISAASFCYQVFADKRRKPGLVNGSTYLGGRRERQIAFQSTCIISDALSYFV